jgi:hypothetical protein
MVSKVTTGKMVRVFVLDAGPTQDSSFHIVGTIFDQVTKRASSSSAGLWWAEDMTPFEIGPKADWYWTAMIAQPIVVTPEWFERARTEVQRKKQSPGVQRARLEGFDEGRAAQVLYLAVRRRRADHREPPPVRPRTRLRLHRAEGRGDQASSHEAQAV